MYLDDGEGNGMYPRNTFVNNGLLSWICIGSPKIPAYYLRMLAYVIPEAGCRSSKVKELYVAMQY